MKKPINFNSINYTYFKHLGIDWQVNVSKEMNEELVSRLYIQRLNDLQIKRVIMLDIAWHSEHMSVYLPKIGDGNNGPYVMRFDFSKTQVKSLEEFTDLIKTFVRNILLKFNLKEGEVSDGYTTLNWKVKSDTSDKEYSVDYIGGMFSCSCKGFVYSKSTPPTCKHIDKIKQ